MTIQTPPLDSVLETIGQTPLVELETGPDGIDCYAKLETFNPGGSIKDRIGQHILKRLLETGELSQGGTIVEPTAGNTGIGMAIAARQQDIHPIFVVPEGFSEEKETLMAALGGEIVTTPGEAGMNGAIERAHEIAAEKPNAVVPQQFASPYNREAHAKTTGPEIIEALQGEVGAIVVGIGSGGTLMGIADALEKSGIDAAIVAVEPEGSTFGEKFGVERTEEAYKTEGIGTHEPELAELIEPDRIDDIVSVSDRAAHEEVARLARNEGHLVGSSSGAASVATRRVANRLQTGDLGGPAESVVTVFPDSGERYLSKGLYGEFADWEGKA
ncbi:PLP-dependent cysteine synthase family protein [Halodesulfurarchaeum sp.]|uniref:PLP-dependent cysteine synthase family protein n=1 Tax=Halodesulfurarchaeum sp. TaxID=1980530 RepID=UPI002FC3CE93